MITRNEQNVRTRKWAWKVVLLGLICAIFALGWVLKFSGKLLVSNDTVIGVTYGLVLEGQGRDMYRTNYGLQLLKEGKIDTLVVSGVRAFKNRHLSDFYIEDLLENGGDTSRIIALQHDSRSTLQEAMQTIPFFKAQGAKKVLLITSAYHSARAKRIFNKVSGGFPYFVAMDIGDPVFRAENWIYDRESRKMWFYEVSKTLLALWELKDQKPLRKSEPDWNQWRSAKQVIEGSGLVPVEDCLTTLETPPLDSFKVLPDSVKQP